MSLPTTNDLVPSVPAHPDHDTSPLCLNNKQEPKNIAGIGEKAFRRTRGRRAGVQPQLRVLLKDRNVIDGSTERAERMVEKLMENGCGSEIARDLSTLVLYDLVVLMPYTAEASMKQRETVRR